MKKNILMISIYYPPFQSIASHRLYSFAKYLNKNKFSVFVHTLKHAGGYENDLGGVEVSREVNSSLFKPFVFKNRRNKVIHYSKVIHNKLVNFFSEDLYQDWINRSEKKLCKLIERDNIDILLSSFSPTSSHRLALRLKKKYPHLKWIADMRDEMSASPFISNNTRKKYQRLEQDIFKYCDAITSVSKPILDEFKDLSGTSKLRFAEIRNGYDFELENTFIKNEKFTISYVGNFYGDRNPNNFLNALALLVESKKISEFKIQFIGVKTHFKIPENLQQNLVSKPSVSHDDAILAMKNSDALLLIHPNNGRKGVFTGKLFEYLACLKPIIALVDPKDVAAELIRECDAGHVADFDDLEAIKNVIIIAYNEWEIDQHKVVNQSVIELHHRKKQVTRLEVLIDRLLTE